MALNLERADLPAVRDKLWLAREAVQALQTLRAAHATDALLHAQQVLTDEKVAAFLEIIGGETPAAAELPTRALVKHVLHGQTLPPLPPCSGGPCRPRGRADGGRGDAAGGGGGAARQLVPHRAPGAGK